MENVLLLFWVCCPDQCYFSYSQGLTLDFRVPQLLGFNSQLAPTLLLSIIYLDNQPVDGMHTLAFYLICLSLGHVGLGTNQGARSHLGFSDSRMSYLPVRLSSDVIKLHFHLNNFTAKNPVISEGKWLHIYYGNIFVFLVKLHGNYQCS